MVISGCFPCCVLTCSQRQMVTRFRFYSVPATLSHEETRTNCVFSPKLAFFFVASHPTAETLSTMRNQDWLHGGRNNEINKTERPRVLRLVQNYSLHIIYLVHQWVKMTISCHPFFFLMETWISFIMPQTALHWQGCTDDWRGIGRQIQMILFLTARRDVFLTQLSIYWQAHPFLLNDELLFNQN